MKIVFIGIVKLFKSVFFSLVSVIKIIKGLGNIFKWLGIGMIVGVIFVIVGFVDGLCVIVIVGKMVVNVIMVILNGVKGFWKWLKGDFKGVDKVFKDMKKSLFDIEKDWDIMFFDFVLKKVVKSIEELGEKFKDIMKVILLNMEEVFLSVENYFLKFDEVK